MNNPLEVTCETVREKLDTGEDFVLLDCREEQEYETARIDGARLIPMSEMQDRVAELNELQGQEIIVHCHHGMRSLQVTHWLRQQGFDRVFSMAGGIDRWSEVIDPDVARY